MSLLGESDRLQIWKFVRGDLAPHKFDDWLKTNPSLASQLGHGLYQQLIEKDFSRETEVVSLKRVLREFMTAQFDDPCLCIRLADLSVVPMGSHEPVFENLERVLARGEPHWWLHLVRCQMCTQAWLMAQEERVHDVFVLRRLSTQEADQIQSKQTSPQEFDDYDAVVQAAQPVP